MVASCGHARCAIQMHRLPGRDVLRGARGQQKPPVASCHGRGAGGRGVVLLPPAPQRTAAQAVRLRTCRPAAHHRYRLSCKPSQSPHLRDLQRARASGGGCTWLVNGSVGACRRQQSCRRPPAAAAGAVGGGELAPHPASRKHPRLRWPRLTTQGLPPTSLIASCSS